MSRKPATPWCLAPFKVFIAITPMSCSRRARPISSPSFGQMPTTRTSSLCLPRLGTTGRTSLLIAGDLLFAGEGPSSKVQGGEPFFRACDKASGELRWETRLGSHVVGAPMTYRVGGRQCVAVATGGFGEPHELVVFALRESPSN